MRATTFCSAMGRPLISYSFKLADHPFTATFKYYRDPEVEKRSEGKLVPVQYRHRAFFLIRAADGPDGSAVPDDGLNRDVSSKVRRRVNEIGTEEARVRAKPGKTRSCSGPPAYSAVVGIRPVVSRQPTGDEKLGGMTV